MLDESIDNRAAGPKNTEDFRYGSWTKWFVTIGTVAFVAFNPFTVRKVGAGEFPRLSGITFGGGMGTIVDKYNQIFTMGSIAQALDKLGDVEKNEQILEENLESTKSIQNENFHSSILGSIAEASDKLGDVEKGKQLLEKTLEIAKLLKDEYAQSCVLILIAQAYGKLRDMEKGKQILEKTLEKIKSIKDKRYQYQALYLVVEAYRKIDDVEKGKQILEKLSK